jgi:predicted NAD/FAD-binding protein
VGVVEASAWPGRGPKSFDAAGGAAIATKGVVLMSRGTDEITVQRLMDFLYDKQESLRMLNASALPRIGEAYISGNQVWLERESKSNQARAAQMTVLEELRFEIERQCGELYDKKCIPIEDVAVEPQVKP